jgi:glycosyltransferase involved in cell wall biosynthesis
MIEGRDIVLNSFVVWDEHWGTPQQLMSRLARGNRILYIDPPISPLSFFTGIRSRSAVWKQVERWRQGPRKVRDNVWVASPPPVLPLRSHVVTNRINAAIMRRWLSSQVRKMGFRDVIYWNAQPTMPGLARAVSPALKLFHCVDDFSALPHWWHAGRSTAQREEECCREADLVVCTARKLQESRSVFNPNTHFLPNAANIEVFLRAVEPETAIPHDIGRLPKPVVGIFGVIDFRTDVALIERLARLRPGWSFALVGLVKGDVDLAGLRALPNVYVLGRKPTESLAGYLKAMDVCLIAYALIDYNHHVFPLKLYDYMAAGKPIVASDMEELRPIAGPELAIARTDDEWVAAVEASLASDSAGRVSNRQQIAMANSWDSRVEEISELLARELAGRAPGPASQPLPASATVGGQ